MGENHARLGPSNHRWVHCPGSVREEAKYPNIPGSAAIDGTGSHLLLELCMKHQVSANSYEGQIIGVNHVDSAHGWMVNKDRIDRVQMCLDYIDRRKKELLYPRVIVESEQKTYPGGMFGREDWWGTVDITFYAFDGNGICRFVEVCDYKDGQGWVSVKDKDSSKFNTQLVSYAAGQIRPFVASGPELVRPFKPETLTDGVRLSIVQPKTTPVVRYEDIGADVIIEQASAMSFAAFATDKPDAPLIPDSKGGKGYCRWCLHKQNCEALAKQSIETSHQSVEVIAKMSDSENSLIKMIGNTAVMDVTAMAEKQLADIADAEAGISAIFSKVKEEIQSRIENGGDVPGYAMLPGNSSRTWSVVDDEVAKRLKSYRLKKDDIYPPKLVSAPQILKSNKLTDKQKKAIEDELVSNIPGKLTLKKVAVKVEKPKIDFFATVSTPETKKPLSFF